MDVVSPLITFLGTIINFAHPIVDNALNLDEGITFLEAALLELVEARDDLKKQVDQAELLGLTCTNQVKGWLERVENVETQVRSIAQDIENGSNGCKNCCWKYKLSQRVVRNLSVISNLKGKGILNVDMADGMLLVPVVELPNRPAIGLELMLEKVQHLLKEDGVGIIGMYGIGGIGKTTLLKSINNEFLSLDHDFDLVIWAAVSKDYSVEKIQQAIGVRLGLSWEENQFQDLRASRIYSVMRRRKFLLLLDDVWEGLDFDNIGVPIPNNDNGCKVIFTTRSLDVCSDMDANCKLKVEFLNEKQSWKLFEEKVGREMFKESSSSSMIYTYAESIVRKCGGLPLALVTTGRAMANKQTEEEWRYAIEVLNRSPAKLRGMEDVFSLLKFSYDNLGNETLRLCFLYCSLLPEDYAIGKEQLIEYWAGEGFLGSCDEFSFQIMGHTIIGSLKTACFLETGEEETQVKMHDVVRSFALWIASDCGANKAQFLMQASAGLTELPAAENWEMAERISLVDNEITELSGTHVCLNLSTLLLQWNNGLCKISPDFFDMMPKLKVLDLSFTSIRELPKSIGKLIELRHLDLSGTKISALPKELGNLAKLEHLDLQRNGNLKSIPNAALSGFVQLRVLNFYYSFGDWEINHLEGEDEAAELSDLENLPRLTCLGITLANLSALQRISGSRRLRRCVEYLCIRECEGLYNLQLSHRTGDGERLRRLSLNNCPDFKFLAIIDGAEDNWLPNLEILAMHDLPSLVSVWRNPMSKGCLRNLRSINIWYCDKLKNVSWTLLLPKLEMVYLFYCAEMEHVISGDDVEDGEDYANAFPRLRVMSIRKLPKLRSISSEKMSFPCLKKIAVVDCPLLKKLPLKAQKVAELPTIYCYKEWWDALEWDDAATMSTVLPHFTSA